jgi:hypothetical protein
MNRIMSSIVAGSFLSGALLTGVARAQTPAASAARVLATSKTSTLEKELLEAGEAGYAVVGMTVAKTAIGGKELVAITRRAALR